MEKIMTDLAPGVDVVYTNPKAKVSLPAKINSLGKIKVSIVIDGENAIRWVERRNVTAINTVTQWVEQGNVAAVEPEPEAAWATPEVTAAMNLALTMADIWPNSKGATLIEGVWQTEHDNRGVEAMRAIYEAAGFIVVDSMLDRVCNTPTAAIRFRLPEAPAIEAAPEPAPEPPKVVKPRMTSEQRGSLMFRTAQKAATIARVEDFKQVYRGLTMSRRALLSRRNVYMVCFWGKHSLSLMENGTLMMVIGEIAYQVNTEREVLEIAFDMHLKAQGWEAIV